MYIIKAIFLNTSLLIQLPSVEGRSRAVVNRAHPSTWRTLVGGWGLTALCEA
jgi:hypothetical protein